MTNNVVNSNIQKMRDRLAKLNNKNNYSSNNYNDFMSLFDEGSYDIRILGPKTDGAEFLYEVATHKDIDGSGTNVICLQETPSINKPCPVCEMRQQVMDKMAADKASALLIP